MLKGRMAAIRARTYVITVALLFALIVYFLVSVTLRQKINIVDLVVMAFLQIVLHCLYFPDGENSGALTEIHINNRKAYNDKASSIAEGRHIEDLRRFCAYDYEQRKKSYIAAECGKIGITPEDLRAFEAMTPAEIRRTKDIRVGDHDKRRIGLTRRRRRVIIKLIYGASRIEPNDPEEIMSAIESDKSKAIKDESVPYRRRAYVTRVFRATVVGAALAYIAFTEQDGITLSTIVRIVSYLSTMLTTAVMSFSKGETCTKVYKTRYYIELSNFIDAFYEWLAK